MLFLHQFFPPPFYYQKTQFSSDECLDRLGHRRDTRNDSREILFQSVSGRGHCERFWHGQGCPLFDVVHLAFPLPTTTSKATRKDGFVEVLVARDMPEPCECPSPDTCKKLDSWCFEPSQPQRITSGLVARRNSCGPTRKLILIYQSLVLCSCAS